MSNTIDSYTLIKNIALASILGGGAYNMAAIAPFGLEFFHIFTPIDHINSFFASFVTLIIIMLVSCFSFVRNKINTFRDISKFRLFILLILIFSSVYTIYLLVGYYVVIVVIDLCFLGFFIVNFNRYLDSKKDKYIIYVYIAVVAIGTFYGYDWVLRPSFPGERQYVFNINGKDMKFKRSIIFSNYILVLNGDNTEKLIRRELVDSIFLDGNLSR